MASGTWINTATSGAWNTASNWSGSVVANLADFTATFSSNITATTTIDTTTGANWGGTIGNITFSDNGANGSAWTLGSQATITLDVTSGSSTLTTTTSATINGILAGSDPVIKAGAQTLTLAAANTLSGSLTIDVGTLSITNASGLGSNTGRVITVKPGTVLELRAAITGSNLTPDISGTGISGVSNGALVLATAFGTANIGAITLGASASFRAAASATLSSSILTASGRDLTLQAAPTFTGTFSGAITGAGALIVGGTANAVSQTGTVVLSSASNNYAGTTTVSTGTLSITGLLGSGSYAGDIAIASGATFTFSSTSNQTLSGTISGLGTFGKNTGTSSVLTVTGSNTFSVSPSIFAGVVSVASIGNSAANSPLGTNGTISFGIGATTGTLRYTGSGETTDKTVRLTSVTGGGGAIVENNGSGALTFSANLAGSSSSANRRLTLQGANTGANSFAGVISNVGGGAGILLFTKAGIGYWSLTGLNTYTGASTVSAGTLSISSIENVAGGASSLGNPAVGNGTIALGSTTNTAVLIYTGTGHSTDRVVNMAGTTGGAVIEANGSGELSFTNAAGFTATGVGNKTFTLRGSSTSENTFAGAITDAAGGTVVSFAKSGTGTWVLSSASTFAGTATASAGTLRIGNDAALGLGALSLGGVTFTSANSSSRSIANALTITGSVTFGAAVAYTGDFSFGASASLGSATRSLTVNVPVTMSGVISGTGSGGITKAGSETLTLQAANTYPGPTDINAGVVFAKNTSALGTGTATLGASGTLQTSSANGQKGKLTVSSLNNTAGGIIHIGGGFTSIDSAKAFIYAPTTDFSGGSYPIVLDTDSAATEAGSYAIIYSPVPLTDYNGATVTLSGSGFVSVSSVTTATTGDVIFIGGVQYYAVVVTLATVPATSTIDPANAFVFGPSSDFNGQTFPIVLDAATPAGKYAVIYSPQKLTNYVGATVTGPASATVTPAGTGEVVSISGTRYYAVVVTVS